MKDFKEIVYIAPELRALASTKYQPSTHKNHRSLLVSPSPMSLFHLLSEKKRWLYSIIKHHSEKMEQKSQNEKQLQHYGLLSVARQSHLLCSSFPGFCSVVSSAVLPPCHPFHLRFNAHIYSDCWISRTGTCTWIVNSVLKPVILGFDKLVVSKKHVI